MKKYFYNLVVVLSVFSNLFYGMGHVKAQEMQKSTAAIEVSPILNEIAAKPGETVKQQMSIKNLTNLPLPIKVYPREFVATDEYGGSDFPDGEDPTSVQKWFSVDVPDFIIQPKTTRLVNVTVNVPKDAAPGGHYATLFFESLVPKAVLSETSFHLSARIGALYFFVIAGDIKEAGTIKEIKTKRFWQQGPVNFEYAFENKGNIHTIPVTKVTITDWRGNTVGEIDDKGNRILPGKTRRWEIKWDKKRLFGKYTAKFVSTIDEDIRPQEYYVQFWVIPVVYVVLVILGLILLFLIIKGRRRIKKAFKVLRGIEPSTDIINVPQENELSVVKDETNEEGK